MTRDEAISAHVGQWMYHVHAKNRDGSSLRARVNGACKTWKRRPQDFQLPAKYGLRDCFYVTHANCHLWVFTDPQMPALIRREACKATGLVEEAPWQMVHDRLVEMGRDELASRFREACGS